jgi:hypothetical protein
LAATLAIVACGRSQAQKAAPGTEQWPAALLSIPPAELPAAVAERYRIKPDARILGAVGSISRIRGFGATEPATASYLDGEWSIDSGGTEVGRLPELPTFDDATDLLVRWAARSRPLLSIASFQRRPTRAEVSPAAVEAAIASLDAGALVQALARGAADDRSDPQIVRATTRGLAWLATLTVDSLQQSDPLLAEAWAWLVVARQKDSSRDPAGDALIARALGYESAAALAAGPLPADDPIRAFAGGEAKRLDALCASGTDPRAHFLRLALLSEEDDAEGFQAALAASPFATETAHLPLLGLETRVTRLESGASTGALLATLAREEVAPPAVRARRNASGAEYDSLVQERTRDFESEAKAFSEQLGPGAISPTATSSYFRASYYTGLDQEVAYVDGILGSGRDLRAWADAMKDAAPGIADELRRWARVESQLLDGSRSLEPILEFLATPALSGPESRYEMANAIARLVGAQDPAVRKPVAAIFAGLDSRPWHLAHASLLATGNLVSASLFERFGTAAAAAAPHRSLEVALTMARIRRDSDRLRELARDARLRPQSRAFALDKLAELGPEHADFIRGEYERLDAEFDWSPDSYVAYLEKSGQTGRALDVVTAALDRSAGKSATWKAHVASERARLLLELGRTNDAAAAIAPALEVGTWDSLIQAATIELSLSHVARATELARECFERYPDRNNEAELLLVRTMWRMGDFAGAAQRVVFSGTRLGDLHRGDVAEGFALEFAKSPEADLLAAFAALEKAGMAPYGLAEVAAAVGEKRSPDLALALFGQLVDRPTKWHDSVVLRAYDFLLAKSGSAEAAAWVAKRLPQRDHGFAVTLLQQRREKLLLDLYSDGSPADNPRMVRALRAAAHVYAGETAGPRWDQLRREVGKDQANDVFCRVARYLTGLSDESSMLTGIHNLGDVATLGWALGLKAAGDGKFHEAERWLQVALETGAAQEQPVYWALGIEWKWRREQRSIEIPGRPGEF